MSKIETILRNIENGMTDLTQLKIQTVMGRLEIDDEKHIDFVTGQEIEGIISKIDLIDGDITTKITEKFYQNYPELVQFHQSREAKGQEIIQANIQTLKTIVTTLTEIFNTAT